MLDATITLAFKKKVNYGGSCLAWPRLLTPQAQHNPHDTLAFLTLPTPSF